MCDIFLKKDEGVHYIHLLGKNGEPKPRVKVSVHFKHQRYTNRNVSVTLTSDKEGRVKLGILKDIETVEAHVELFGCRQQWLLSKPFRVTYPATLDVLEGEIYEFPITSKAITRKNISLIKKRRSDDFILEDCFDKLEFIPQSEKSFNLIRVKNLPVGEYDLVLKKL